MTKTEKRIAELESYIERDLSLIKDYQRGGYTRDEQIAADRLAGVEKELRRLVTNGNGNAAQPARAERG